uniref:Tumor necrosis factor receptor type 5 n=1 Tax=Pinctada imbricata TaxID=66713 RepID=A0A3G4S7V3_PINIB|nr:tumor necrosis factor receptor type 5 [Pinctada imbricata]
MNTGALLFCTSLTVTITVPITSHGHGTDDEGHIVKVERSIDTCQENISEPIYIVNNKYCKCCRPGFYKLADCVKSGEEAGCQMCPAEQYSSTYNQAYRCAPCVPPAFCSKENVERYQGCTRTSNIKCRCRAGYYFKERLGSVDDGDCREHSKCGAGTYIFLKGTRETDAVCRQCPNGTFSTSENNLVCRNCSVCDTTDTVPQKCTATTDTKCNSKQQGAQHGGDSRMIKIVVPICAGVVVVAIALVVIYMVYKNKTWCMMNIQRFLKLPNGDNVDGNRDSEAMKLQQLQNSQANRHVHVSVEGEVPFDPNSAMNAPLVDKTPPEVECVEVTSEVGQGIPKLSGSPVHGSFHFLKQQDGNSLGVPVLQNSHGTQGISTQSEQDHNKKAEERRKNEKMWEQCYIYLSQHIVKEWKHVIRTLFAATECTKRPVEVIIQEVEENDPKNVTEQFYQALKKWHNSMEPKNLDLRCIIDALSASNLMDIVENLQKEFALLMVLEKQSVGNVSLPERTDRQTDKDSEALLSDTDAELHRNS